MGSFRGNVMHYTLNSEFLYEYQESRD